MDSTDPKPAGKLAFQLHSGYLLLLLLSATFGFLLYTGEILFAVILLVLAILLVTVFEYTYIRPLKEVCDAARRLGDKDFSAKAPVRGHRAIRDLAEIVNSISLDMEAAHEDHNLRLQEMRKRLQGAVDNYPDPLFLVSPQGNVVPCNEAAVELEKLLSWEGSLPEQLRRKFEIVIQHNEIWEETNTENALISVDGEQNPERWMPKIVPISGSGDSGEREAALILQNLTKLDNRIYKDAESIGTLSHEIRTPLTTLQTSIYILLEGNIGKLNDKQRSLMQISRNDLKRLLETLATMVDYSKITNKEENFQWQEGHAAEILQAVMSECKSRAQQQNVILRLKMEEGLPPMRLDPRFLQRALVNLVGNAIKFSSDGSEVTLYARQCDEEIQFGVLDEGPGVHGGAGDKIFEPFYSKSHGGKPGGAGLGLSFVREVVKAHGGRIKYRNGETGGAEFFFSLPVK